MIKKFVLMLICLFMTYASSVNAGGARANSYSKVIDKVDKSTPVHFLPFIQRSYLTEIELKLVNDELLTQLKKIGYPVTVHENVRTDKGDSIFTFREIIPEKAYAEGWMPSFIERNKMDSGLIVVPSIVERIAKLEGKLALLDGVRLGIRTSKGKSYDFGSWSGTQSGYSIKLEIFDSSGRWLVNSFGGVSMPKYADMKQSRFVRKDNAFSEKKDYRLLKKGVRKALYPLRKFMGFSRKKGVF